MPTTTHKIPIDDTAYVNVSSGNLHCFIQGRGQAMRVIVADSAAPPLVGTDEYFQLWGPQYGRAGVFGVTDLAAGDDVFIRTEAGSDFVYVMRGDAKPHTG